MFLFAIRNEHLLRKLRSRSFLGKFFTGRVEELDSVRDEDTVDHLYKSFYVHNGTSKETRQGRFAGVDEKTLSFLKRDSMNLIHDVGVSSGITSLDLYDRLTAAGYPFALFVSDQFARFYWTGKTIRRIYDQNRVLARAYILSLVVDGKLHWKHFISRYSYQLVKMLPNHNQAVGEVILYDRRLRTLIEEGLVSEIEYDIFSGSGATQFDLVRCMNVLNRCYFSASQISRACDNLKKSLREGGILQVGRTNPEGVNNVSFFRKDKDRLCWIEDVNQGSEIKELVN